MEARRKPPALQPSSPLRRNNVDPKLPPILGAVSPLKGAPVSDVGAMDRMAENIQIMRLRKGGWKGVSEESRTQEVVRHLEWARDMRAAYERQVEECEKELQRYQQSRRLENGQPPLEVNLQPETASEISRKAQCAPRKQLRRRMPDSKRHELPSTPSSSKFPSQPSLNLVRFPALRTPAADGERLRQDVEPQLRVSHFLQVQAAPPASRGLIDRFLQQTYSMPELPPPSNDPKLKPEILLPKSGQNEKSIDFEEAVGQIASAPPGQIETNQTFLASPAKRKSHKRRKKHKKLRQQNPEVDGLDVRESPSGKRVHWNDGFVHPAVETRLYPESVVVGDTVDGGNAENVDARIQGNSCTSPYASSGHGASNCLESSCDAHEPSIQHYEHKALTIEIPESRQNSKSPRTAGHPRLEAWRAIFRRLMDDGEVHAEVLPLALQHAGFPKPNSGWIEDVLQTLTPFSTVNMDEFISFILKYEECEHEAALEFFHDADLDHNGCLDSKEISKVFESFGITPLAHVITDIVEEVGAINPQRLTFDEFWQVMLHLRTHDGFTKSEVKALHDMFMKFDIDQSGFLNTLELSRVLCYLGHALDAQAVDTIVRDVDVDQNGSLDEREFFVCMRKVTEMEVEVLKEVFRECDSDGSGGLGCQELLVILRRLGYFPEIDDALYDAARDAGADLVAGDEMTFDQLWRFLETYREREGFSVAEVIELREVFDQADTIRDGELDSVEVSQLFVRLGLPVSCTQVQRFVANVDIDGSGTIDFHEFMKVVRQLHQHINQKALRAYFDCQKVNDKSGERASLSVLDLLCVLVPWASQNDCKHAASLASANGENSEFKFVSLVTQLRQRARTQVKMNFGFGHPELESLRERFAEYDTDGTGLLSGKEVQHFLESVFLDLATSASMRPQLLAILQEATSRVDGSIDFAGFARLMRKVNDLSELEKIRTEHDVIRAVGFTAQEVIEFRELFLGSTDRESLSLTEVKGMFSSFLPMGYKNSKALTEVFEEVVSKRNRNDQTDATFPDFLLLLRRMLDLDVAGIKSCAQKAIDAAHVEASSQPVSPANALRNPEWIARRASILSAEP